MALAGVAQWIERGLQTKGSLVQFPVRDMPGLWTTSSVGARVRQPHIDVSLPLFLPLSKNK